ncbi:hypothetical protein Poly51_50240 [Rubripirellula tenax]|uniref:Uncharacterized protein n=1 Tax=Rubripirellula tenax TaxID=2528015 RepID=A0A5C6EFD3_9BACT|nr:hypothetical protein Poly51_50240 [Rubripirellula tenax]
MLQIERSELHCVHRTIQRSEESRIRSNHGSGRIFLAMNCDTDIGFFAFGGDFKNEVSS